MKSHQSKPCIKLIASIVVAAFILTTIPGQSFALAPSSRWEAEALLFRPGERAKWAGLGEGLIVDRTTGEVRQTFTKLRKGEFVRLNNVTLKNVCLDKNGLLNIGGKKRAHFSEYGSYPIEIDVDQGVVTGVRVYDQETKKKQLASYPFILIVHRGSGAYQDSVWGKIFASRFCTFDKATIKNLRLDNNGILSIAGRASWAQFNKYPGHRIEIDVDQGVIIEVRIYDNNGHIIEDKDAPDGRRKFAVVVDRTTGRNVDSFWDQIMPARFKKLGKVTVKQFRLASQGSLTIGGVANWASFPDYEGYPVEMDADSGIVTEVRIYDAEGRLICDKQSPDGHRRFAVIVDRTTGQYLDSFWRQFSAQRFSKLDKVVIRGFRLDQNGNLSIGGRSTWAHFSKYPNHLIEVDVDQGVITEARIFDSNGQLVSDSGTPDGHRRFALIVDRASGVVLDSFLGQIFATTFAQLDKVTIKQFLLDGNGNLSIGGRSTWAHFNKYPNHPTEIDIDQGVIAAIRIYDAMGNLLTDEDAPDGVRLFNSIVDRSSGTYKDSFWVRLSSEKLADLNNATIKQSRLDGNGGVTMGGRIWATFIKYPYNKAEIDVDQGIVTEVRIYDDAGRLIVDDEAPDGHRRFAIIADRTSERYLDAFWGQLSPERLKCLSGVTIKYFLLDSQGGLTIAGRCWTTFAQYPRHPIEMEVDEGVIKTVIIYDKNYPDKVIKTIAFKIACDLKLRAMDSFRGTILPKRFDNFVGQVTGYKVGPFNGLKLRRGEVYFFTHWGDLSGKSAEVLFEDSSHPGQVTSFRIGRYTISALQALSPVFPLLVQEVEVADVGYQRVVSRVPSAPEPSTAVMHHEFRQRLDEAIADLQGNGVTLAGEVVKLVSDPEFADTEDETREEQIARRLGITPNEVFLILRQLSEHPKLRDFRPEVANSETGASAPAFAQLRSKLEQPIYFYNPATPTERYRLMLEHDVRRTEGSMVLKVDRESTRFTITVSAVSAQEEDGGYVVGFARGIELRDDGALEIDWVKWIDYKALLSELNHFKSVLGNEFTLARAYALFEKEDTQHNTTPDTELLMGFLRQVAASLELDPEHDPISAEVLDEYFQGGLRFKPRTGVAWAITEFLTTYLPIGAKIHFMIANIDTIKALRAGTPWEKTIVGSWWHKLGYNVVNVTTRPSGVPEYVLMKTRNVPLRMQWEDQNNALGPYYIIHLNPERHPNKDLSRGA